jgi:hypothetical protein
MKIGLRGKFWRVAFGYMLKFDVKGVKVWERFEFWEDFVA